MIDPAYVSVDIETSGPNPSQYSMLSIGACLVHDFAHQFYVELQPLPGAGVRPETLDISHLSLEHLAEHGAPPKVAMARFEAWAWAAVPEGHRPIFVAFNAPFDWSFVNDYFHRFLGHNPFGHTALDVKAFYMGLTGVSWPETAMRHILPRYPDARPLTHNALQDAMDQAYLFRRMLDEQAALSRQLSPAADQE